MKTEPFSEPLRYNERGGTPTGAKKFASIPEAAATLNVTYTAVLNAIREGRLDSVSRYGRRFIPRTALMLYIARTRPEGVKPRGRPRKLPPAILEANKAITEIIDNP